jgi:hypothetical protein
VSVVLAMARLPTTQRKVDHLIPLGKSELVSIVIREPPNSGPSLVSSHHDAQNRLLLCLVLPKSHAGMGLAPCLDRARNRMPH